MFIRKPKRLRNEKKSSKNHQFVRIGTMYFSSFWTAIYIQSVRINTHTHMNHTWTTAHRARVLTTIRNEIRTPIFSMDYIVSYYLLRLLFYLFSYVLLIFTLFYTRCVCVCVPLVCDLFSFLYLDKKISSVFFTSFSHFVLFVHNICILSQSQPHLLAFSRPLIRKCIVSYLCLILFVAEHRIRTINVHWYFILHVFLACEWLLVCVMVLILLS